MELTVDLGPMPIDEKMDGIVEGLRDLVNKNELCDVILVAGDQSFVAHRAALAAVSPGFHECLMRMGCNEGMMPGLGGANAKPMVVKLDDVSHPEAVQAMLDCIYGQVSGSSKEYSPSSEDANRDVLRLAERFQISQLQDQAARWLARNLSTANVLERLLACEEFGLTDVREKILEQLTANPDALFALAKDPEMTKVPAVLQDLLVRILKLLGCDPAASQARTTPPQGKAPQGKHAKKAGAAGA